MNEGIGHIISGGIWLVFGLVIFLKPDFLWKVEGLFLGKKKKVKEPTTGLLWLMRFCGLLFIGMAIYGAVQNV